MQLEDFLIANRDEYLRHSAMNYTSQQRQYNNRLTERLLELAARHGYVFDEEDFGEYQVFAFQSFLALPYMFAAL